MVDSDCLLNYKKLMSWLWTEWVVGPLNALKSFSTERGGSFGETLVSSPACEWEKEEVEFTDSNGAE